MSSVSSVLERPVAPSADLPTSANSGAVGGDLATSASSGAVGGKPRVIGVDVARGLALVGMMATHAFDTIGEDGNPTLVHVLAGGRAAATFVLLAGVSLAFLSGGRTAVRGRGRIGASAGLAVRAVLIGAIGLALGYLAPFNGIAGILSFYGLFFLLAIPLLGCRAPVLLGIAAAASALGPVLIVATADTGLPGADGAADPTFTTLVHDPLGLLVQLFLTGEYPAVVYLVLLCVGMVIGRLDLSSRRLGGWLFAGGVALAIAARVGSALLLYPMGGLARLIEQGDLDDEPTGVSKLLWDPELTASWWYLALPAPHAHTPIDLLHTLGSAAAVLGAALLLTRVGALARLLWPLAAAGSMSLTLYSAHLAVLATGVLEDQPLLLLLAMAVAALVLATFWRGRFRQGPLEALVARPATAARRAAIGLADGRATTPTSSRGWVSRTARSGAQFLAPLACAGVLALMFFAGAGAATPAADGSDDVTDAPGVSEVSQVPDLSEADDPADDLADDPADVSEAGAPGPVAEQASDAEPVEAPSTTADEPGMTVLLLWIMCGIGAGLFVMMFLIARLSCASACS